MEASERIVVLIDMDCFYVQVEQREKPEYLKKPCAVAQYTNWKNGGIIAVNYEARAFGVKRGMLGDEAQKLCPEIKLFRVPDVGGKANLTKYRNAGSEVIDALKSFTANVERASIDEAFLDITKEITSEENNKLLDKSGLYVIGWDNLDEWLEVVDPKLIAAANYVSRIRNSIFATTGFHCSAGIAHNKVLSKVICGLNKPNKQTLLPAESISILYATLPITSMRHLGGKFGEEVKEKLGIETMGQLANISHQRLLSLFGTKNGAWLFNLAQGIEHEPVVARFLAKSIGCGKNFPGKSCLGTLAKLQHWVDQLAKEISVRLCQDQIQNKRKARTMTLCYRTTVSDGTISRSCPLVSFMAKRIADDAMSLLRKGNNGAETWDPPIANLSLVASKFEDTCETKKIESFFKKCTAAPSASGVDNNPTLPHAEFSASGVDNNPTLPHAEFSASGVDNNPTLPPAEFSAFGVDNNPTLLHAEFSASGVNNNPALCHAGKFSTLLENLQMEKAVGEKESSAAPITMETGCEPEGGNSGQPTEATPLDPGITSQDPIQSQDSSNKRNAGKTNPSLLLNKKAKLSPQKKSTRSRWKKRDRNQGTIEAFVTTTSPKKAPPVESRATTSSGTLPAELCYVCRECRSSVPVWEREEHSDFHLAQQLQEFADMRPQQPHRSSNTLHSYFTAP